MRLQVADPATEMLGVLDEAAAMDNDRIALFASEVGDSTVCLALRNMLQCNYPTSLVVLAAKKSNCAWVEHSAVLTRNDIIAIV